MSPGSRTSDITNKVTAARLTAELLERAPGARRPTRSCTGSLAVQAQDARGARLAVRSRSVGLHATDVDDALNDGRLVITWVNRGTLHLIDAEDYWWLHPLTTPQLETGNRRRLRQEGVSERQAERGVDVVAEAVSHGPQTRAELRERLDAAEVPTARQALVHVLLAATLRGNVVRGPMRGSEHAFVAVSDWLGDAPEPLDRPDALARLARRYLAGHGPADAARPRALGGGHTGRRAHRRSRGIADEVTETPDGLVDLADRATPARLPKPRLLGPFDPLLLGWVSREPFVGTHQGVVTNNGLFRACALVKGRVVATWGLSGTTLTLKPLEPVSAAVVKALRADAADVVRFLGLADETEFVVDQPLDSLIGRGLIGRWRCEALPGGVLGDDTGLDELQEVVGAAGLGADAREPEAAEGLAPDECAGDPPVDVDVPGPEPARRLGDPRRRPREQAGGERVVGVVGERERVVEVVGAHHREQRAEDLVGRDTCARVVARRRSTVRRTTRHRERRCARSTRRLPRARWTDSAAHARTRRRR